MTIIIKNWSKHYEKSDHKKCKGMKWVAVPIEFSNKGYKRLMKMKDGTEIFGAWLVLLQLAAKQPIRGELRDGDGDLSFEDMELITECPANTLKKAVSVLSGENFGWFQEVCGKIPQSSADPPTTLQDITLQDITEQNKTNESEDDMPKEISPVFYDVAEHLKKRVLETRQNKITDKTIKEWANIARLMNTYDKRTVEQMNQLIDECHNMEPRGNNNFTWRNNILSMSKLRLRWNEGKIAIGMNKPFSSQTKTAQPF